MEIQLVRFIEEDGSQIEIIFSDLNRVSQPHNTNRYKYTNLLNKWIAEGNTIEPYDSWYGQTLEQIKESKYSEIWGQANQKIDEAINQSDATNNLNKRQRLLDKSHQRLSKKSKSIDLTSSELLDETWFDTFLLWSDTVNKEADESCAHVKDMTDKEHVVGYDTNVDIIWTDYVSPYPEWDSDNVYAINDVVIHNEGRWVSISDNNHTEPDDNFTISPPTGDWLPV